MEVKNVKIGFSFIKATEGLARVDRQFKRNWRQAELANVPRGAYHFFLPNKSGKAQAKNFMNTVKLKAGDLPPVLDIEQMPDGQSMDSLKSGLQRWLDKVEGHYGMKPIIYSGESFYNDFLEEEFASYNLWIANYSFFEDELQPEWLFWQFTDKAVINGVEGNVDVNIYNGSMAGLKSLTKR